MASTRKQEPHRGKGRPREFLSDKAIDAAMMVFWQKGYDGASLPDLTRAMKINKSSLYACFGSKENLFEQAIERYSQQTDKKIREILAQKDIQSVIEKILLLAADGNLHGKSRGCLLLKCAMSCSAASEQMHRELAAKRNMIELALHSRLILAVNRKEILPSVDISALAKFVVTLQQGLAIQNAGGAKKEELISAVTVAMTAIRATLTEKKQ